MAVDTQNTGSIEIEIDLQKVLSGEVKDMDMDVEDICIDCDVEPLIELIILISLLYVCNNPTL
jgi:hypothetical protein